MSWEQIVKQDIVRVIMCGFCILKVHSDHLAVEHTCTRCNSIHNAHVHGSSVVERSV